MNFFSLWNRRAGTLLHCTAMPAMVSVVAASFIVLGCGMAASPQPPSLELPKPVHDLTASRAGNRVVLHWTTPSETTDKLKINRPVSLEICSEEKVDSCRNVATITATAGQPAEYTEILPESLRSGPLRPITYEIFGLNKHGRSAGPSNAALALAGETPPCVEHISATMVERGVLFHWQSMPSLGPGAFIQLERTLLTPPAPHNATLTGIPFVAEPAERKLEISEGPNGGDPGTALDSSVAFNQKYEYVALRVVRQKHGTQQLQVTSLLSERVVIVTRDTFPPAAPTGLAAVPVSPAMNNGIPEIDLSWSANTEPDVAQYLVYRRDAGASSDQSTARQVGPGDRNAPIVAPTFRDLHVRLGDKYAYYVIAVDGAGNRSAKSAEVVATVPTS